MWFFEMKFSGHDSNNTDIYETVDKKTAATISTTHRCFQCCPSYNGEQRHQQIFFNYFAYLTAVVIQLKICRGFIG